MRKLFTFIFFVFACSICASLLSCDPEIITETEIVTVNDTLTISTTDTLLISTTDTVLISITDTVLISTTDTLLIPDDAEVTNFILVRHAEISTGNNPILTQEGLERAEKLANILSEMKIDRVYSTNFNRTTQTATPTANNQGLTISNYGGFDHQEVVNDILDNVNEGNILIVGHGNTTPNFLNFLTGTSNYADLAEDAFDNLFIVNTKSIGESKVIHLRY